MVSISLFLHWEDSTPTVSCRKDLRTGDSSVLFRAGELNILIVSKILWLGVGSKFAFDRCVKFFALLDFTWVILCPRALYPYIHPHQRDGFIKERQVDEEIRFLSVEKIVMQRSSSVS